MEESCDDDAAKQQQRQQRGDRDFLSRQSERGSSAGDFFSTIQRSLIVENAGEADVSNIFASPSNGFLFPSIGRHPLPRSSPCRDTVHAFSFSAVVPGEHECMHCRQRALALGFSQLNLHLGIWVCEACDPKNFKP